MDDIDSDWDTEEFQAALKTVLKCEIQSLLERLSKTGEETVLLTVNTVDMCVSHLASSNAQKFVNSADVGQVKMKFLQYVSGRPSNVLSYQKPLVKADQDCGAYSDSETNNQTNWTGSNTTLKQALKRGQDFTQPDLQGSQNKRPKLDLAQSQPTSQPQKNSNIIKSAGTLPGSGKNSELVGKNPLYSDGDNTREKSQDQGVNKAKMDIKLNTTKIVSKSGGFTEERLSEKEFNNLLKMCNSDMEEEEEEFSGEEYIEAEGIQLPSQLSFLLQGKQSTQIKQQQSPQLQQQQQQQRPSAPLTSTPTRPTGLILPPKTSTSLLVTNRLNPELNPKGQLPGKPDSKSELEKDIASQVNRYKLSGEDGGSVRKSIPTNTVVRDSDSKNIIINPLMNTEIKEEKDPNDTEYRQSDPNKSRTVGVSEKQGIQEKENRADGIGVQKDIKQNTQKPANQAQLRPLLDDDLDTETLIKMAKAKHKENESDADKAIQAKLGQLSSKLSWVVEYPKDEKDSWKAQPHQPQRVMVNQVLGKVFPGQPELEEEEEEEEDYDDEDFEDELDEEELAALKAYHEKQISEGKIPRFPGVGSVTAQFKDMHGEGYHGEYVEEEEEEYGEEYDLEEEEMEDGGMGHYMGSQPEAVGKQVSGEASPHFENFLLIGPIMAKCLICNKLIRKTEMKSHNQSHIEEAEEEMDETYEEMDDDENWEEDVDGEEGIGEEDQGEGEGFIHQVEGFDQQAGAFSNQRKGQGQHSNMFIQQGEVFERKGEGLNQQMQDSGQHEQDGEEFNEEGNCAQEEKDNELNEHYEEETEELAEYTAEKFVAEKVELPTEGGGKKKKNTTCDICNKDFKTHANMNRHRKIHTDSGTHSCHLCPKSFKQASYLAAHIKKKHRDQKEDTTKPAEQNRDVVTEEKSLTEHMETHKD